MTIQAIIENVLKAFKHSFSQFLGFLLQFTLSQHITDKFAWCSVHGSIPTMLINERTQFIC